MAQHLNLLDASFTQQRQRLGSSAALLALALTIGLAAGTTAVLTTWTQAAVQQAADLEHDAAALRLRSQALVLTEALPEAAELARLKALEARQKQVRAAIDAGLVGATQGYSEYLLALARQSQSNLWLTAFNIAPDGQALEIAGRMTDPRHLPGYLRRLNAEPLFKGREFAQLSVKASLPDPAALVVAESAPLAGQTDFALRSTVAPAEATK